jgi:hypothetical protein
MAERLVFNSECEKVHVLFSGYMKIHSSNRSAGGGSKIRIKGGRRNA